MSLPPLFCWSKYGVEAGELAELIVERKERERRLNHGVFLWGIGNSIQPSLEALLERTLDPEVFFTPMLSGPARCDALPRSLVTWTSATGIDGSTYEMAPHSVVISGPRNSEQGKRHYALVCRAADAITAPRETAWIDPAMLRNLRSGREVGASQVTSVVKRVPTVTRSRTRYRVSFRAVLAYPYFLTLTGPRQLKTDERGALQVVTKAESSMPLQLFPRYRQAARPVERTMSS